MRNPSPARDTYSLLIRGGAKRLGRLDKNEGSWTRFHDLCQKFADRIGYIEIDRAQEIIFEFERLLIDELQTKKIVRLFGFGDFFLVHSPPKKISGCARDTIKGKTNRFVREDTFEVKFHVNQKLRDHFRALSDRIDKNIT
jgi:nucleoid DNA-binding protein